jgi:hypothetical protein
MGKDERPQRAHSSSSGRVGYLDARELSLVSALLAEDLDTLLRLGRLLTARGAGWYGLACLVVQLPELVAPAAG